MFDAAGARGASRRLRHPEGAGGDADDVHWAVQHLAEDLCHLRPGQDLGSSDLDRAGHIDVVDGGGEQVGDVVNADERVAVGSWPGKHQPALLLDRPAAEPPKRAQEPVRAVEGGVALAPQRQLAAH